MNVSMTHLFENVDVFIVADDGHLVCEGMCVR
jgi:hypothetical protein